MSDAHLTGELTVLDALIALADPAKWLRYCELLAEIRDGMSQLGQGSQTIFGPQHQDYTSYGRSRLRRVYATSTERQQLTQWDSWATRVPNGAALIDEVQRLDDELVTDFREAAGTGRFAATRVFGTARQPFDPSLIERRDHELRLDVDVIRPPDGHIISGVRIRILYFSLAQVVGWIRGHDAGTAVRQIRSALESRCASGQIGARGQRRIYVTDRVLPVDPTDPDFVRFSDEYSEPHPWFELISAAEWKDLTFFARPDHVPGEQYHEALARALDELRSPVELRSKSRSRLVWTGVEFSRDDVMLVWPRAGRAALPAETTLRAELRTDPTRGAPAEPEAGTKPPPAARDDADDKPKRRLEYKPKLETFMRGGKPRGLRLELTDESITRQFVDYCKDLQRAGKQAPRLPQDIRNIERQVAKIRERIAAAGARKTDPNTG